MATGKSSIKVARFEIAGLDVATRNRWRSLAQSVKRVTNCFWRNWLVAIVRPAILRGYESIFLN